MHRLQRPANSQKQHHEPLLRKPGPIHQVRINRILQIPPPKIRQQNIHRLRTLLRPSLRRNAVVDRMDDVWVSLEQRVGLNFFEGKGYGFLAEGAADLF